MYSGRRRVPGRRTEDEAVPGELLAVGGERLGLQLLHPEDVRRLAAHDVGVEPGPPRPPVPAVRGRREAPDVEAHDPQPGRSAGDGHLHTVRSFRRSGTPPRHATYALPSCGPRSRSSCASSRATGAWSAGRWCRSTGTPRRGSGGCTSRRRSGSSPTTAAADPRFVYANLTAQRWFEYGWDDLIGRPSRQSAGPEEQAERDRLLAEAARKGWSDGYRGVRVSRTGTAVPDRGRADVEPPRRRRRAVRPGRDDPDLSSGGGRRARPPRPLNAVPRPRRGPGASMLGGSRATATSVRSGPAAIPTRSVHDLGVLLRGARPVSGSDGGGCRAAEERSSPGGGDRGARRDESAVAARAFEQGIVIFP